MPSLESPESPASALSKTYDPTSVESRWYDIWEKAGYFQPTEKGKPYVIVIPPPNVTGSLHMGHALNLTLQDILIRFKRMQGYAVLWVPGTDHGGIATQNVVEKMLQQQKVSRHELGRERFLERMWEWRRQTGDTILNQFKKLGAALDMTRSRFTMDEVCSRAVRKAFVDLYQRKLLYRGNRLVNWCPRCATALADIEVEHQDTQGHLWHIRYPLVDRRKRTRPKKKEAGPSSFDTGHLIVATTRPETMLGDTGVAVHPKDKRYKEVVGGRIALPLTGRQIPVVADEAVDKSFGSGAVKVTPAHDPVDFEIAARKTQPHLTVIGFDGKMTEAAGPAYAGLDRFEARQKVVQDLEARGLLEKVEDYNLAVSVCYRCDSVVEPLESEQWFLSMAQMARKALEASKKKRLKIVPKSWENPYRLWLRNLMEWCVSRQIWWGHRIPVWTCGKKGCPPIVSMEDPTSCPTCKGQQLTQDPDVLDTWFSSALWPFSVFHWPEATADLKRFFPTATLVTGHEILYLWVARMVMFGLEFMGKVPFSNVLIHGIVRDKKGRKMSKSLGNVIDPLDLINEFGADAVRFSLAQSAAPGRDMQISKENFVATRNFSNKIWNATRFALMHLRRGQVSSIRYPGKGLRQSPSESRISDTGDLSPLELADRWILHRYNEVVKETTEAIEGFNVDAAARLLYDFFWADLCDWYLEMVKPRVDREHFADIPVTPESSAAARAVLATVVEGSLKLLHPFIPFITEELWEKIPKSAAGAGPHLSASTWPAAVPAYNDPAAAKQMRLLQEIVTKLRTIRSEMGIPPNQPIEVLARTSRSEAGRLLTEQAPILKCLNSRVGKLTIGAAVKRPKGSAVAVVSGADLYVPLEGLIDFEKQLALLEKELALEKENADRLRKKVRNQDFLTHAPPDEVEKARSRLKESEERVKRLEENIATLR